MINGYSIKTNDRFAEALYPAIAKEVKGIHHALVHTRALYKSDIVISFAKSHSLKSEWLAGNKEATQIVTSGSLAISNLESLFQSSKDNPQFTDGLEAYIRLKLQM